jgi:predicted polyphosphate/ATP-dependent NAD kinase
MPHSDSPPRRLGLIVNPVAGLGGRVGLKGTDGAELQRRALELGAVPRSAARAGRTLDRLAGAQLTLVTGAGSLGEQLARERGLDPHVVGCERQPTTGEDTREAARAMLEDGVDLLLFAGGDGTAREILAAVGSNLPVLGIPAGVKMRSGVFASTPEAAGDAALAFLRDDATASLRDGEVVDLDEQALRGDRSDGRLYGTLRVPAVAQQVLAAKRQAAGSRHALDAVCEELARELRHGLAIVGPGTTTALVLHFLGVEGSLLGIDVVRDGALVVRDASEQQLLDELDGGPATIVMGIVGGQGVLFGRGNQPISGEVIRRAGPASIVIVAGLDKLQALDPPWLRVDTGDDDVDRMLSGYRRVRYAPSMSALLKIAS